MAAAIASGMGISRKRARMAADVVSSASGASVAEAMDVANRAGGIVVGKLGTATVSVEELFSEGQA